MTGDRQPAKGYAHPLRFAMGMLGITITSQMYTAYHSFFYNDRMGLPLAVISLGTVFFTIWDALNDPLMGYLSDRTRTRMGRRKPWLLIVAPLFALFSVLLFSPPSGLSQPALAIYFTVTLMATETCGTVLTTNYHALFPELYKKADERTGVNALRQALQFVGLIIGVSMTPLLVNMLDYSATAILLGLLGMGLVLFCALGCREDPRHSEGKAPGLIDSFRAVLKNRNFWLVSLTNMFYQASVGLVTAAIPFFIKYALTLGSTYTTLLTGVVFVIAIPAMAVWARVIRRRGALATWRLALLMLCLSFVPMFFAKGIVVAVASGALIGIGIAGVTANIDLVNARIIDEDRQSTGVAREGTFQAAIGFVIRLSGLMRALVFLLVSVLFGFVDSNSPGENPGLAARCMLSLFPVIFMAISWFVSRFVRFEEEVI